MLSSCWDARSSSLAELARRHGVSKGRIVGSNRSKGSPQLAFRAHTGRERLEFIEPGSTASTRQSARFNFSRVTNSPTFATVIRTRLGDTANHSITFSSRR